MSDDAIERLELKVAYLERAQQELSDALYSQRQEVDRLAARLDALISRLADSDGGPQRFDPEAERPPHY